MTDRKAYYRQRAEHCLRMAETASCVEHRAFLIEAVRGWRLLAERQESGDGSQRLGYGEVSPDVIRTLRDSTKAPKCAPATRSSLTARLCCG
jgi:hypothetical protein